MVGRARLANVRACLEDVISRDVAGDVIEAGAWRGGASIYMRAVLKAWNVSDRRVYVADSFEGLPAPSVEEYPADASAFPFHDVPMLAVSLDDVRANFARFGLADDLVVFVKGWFKDTLPTLSDQRWAVIRLDGDLYESTTQALQALYPNLVPGGWIIIDDYHDIDVCRQAVDDFRTAHSITEPLQDVDWSAVCWQRAE
jgi:O-methyltransferase